MLKSVIIVKRNHGNLEVYSSLAKFIKLNPGYSYSTIDNYIGRKKVAFKDDMITLDRIKLIIELN